MVINLSSRSMAEIGASDAVNLTILELIVMRVRLKAQRRVAWLNHLWGHEAISSASGFEQYLQTCLDDGDRPSAEASWYETSAGMLNDRINQVEQQLAQDEKLQRLAAMFHLSEPELDVLQGCVAIAADPTLGPVYGYLQQHSARTYTTETLVARLFDYGYQSLWNPTGPLAIWGLVRAGEAAAGEPLPLAVDAAVVDWLQGTLRLDTELVERVNSVQPHPALDSWPVEETAKNVEKLLQHQAAVRVLVKGPAASGRRTFAAAVAARFGLEILSVDTSQISEADWSDFFVRTQRLAVMGGLALAWYGSGLHHSWLRQIAPAPLQFVICEENFQDLSSCIHAVDHPVTLPVPTLEERRRLWNTAIPEAGSWQIAERETLVSRYRLSVGEIMAVGQRQPASPQDAAAIARELTRQRLGNLGQLLNCPFSWDDLVLPGRVRQELEDVIFEAQERSTFWEQSQAQRLFPRGTGLVALFSGPPGTGKTMAAQVLAADLALDLFRIDLATVVSKYIGETAKHLGQIFARATRMNAVLLFDEADSLFSKRTEVKDSHDRHANADTSYLLQLLEDYRGIVILATNKKQNIDPAFTRRMRYVLDFPRPDKSQRYQIWTQVIGEMCGQEICQGLNSTISTLAEGVELSGAQIKNAVLSAIFMARRQREAIGMPHLLRGVERELNKEGRSMGSREKGRLMNNG
ncbi:ATP-binding protein [Leptolyngbya cf. ectocarpi LEGE 11479]|uniref:ATP-binding protein n=1 Tax=Leptolyngbya cf. ectocarpi LEGE 11479 TaxID=1828722 RepID=A0A928X4J6_LEPEC|nr:ATP-binding protein [Leptolyngbya ectocarpi]MBE9066458.1 ATP-binding protein [Leptolyngbya cf. ectocarpi LEGE 11479]